MISSDDFFSLAPKYRTKKALDAVIKSARREAIADVAGLFAPVATYSGAEIHRRLDLLRAGVAPKDMVPAEHEEKS